MAISARRPSFRSLPKAAFVDCCPLRFPSLDTTSSSATPSTSTSTPATSGSRRSVASTSSCAGTGRSSPTLAASKSSRWATARLPMRSRAAHRPGPTAPARCSESRRTASATALTSTARLASWARRIQCGSKPTSALTSRLSSMSARRSTSSANTRPARPSARTAGSIAALAGTLRTARPISSSME